MALYDLVSLKKALQESSDLGPVIQALTDLEQRIAQIDPQIPGLDEHHRTYVKNLANTYKNFIPMVTVPHQLLITKISEIDSEIAEITQRLFTGNYDLENFNPKPDWLRANRQLTMSPDVADTVVQRLIFHANWRYPGLEIGCQDGAWTEHLVAADPLYIMDRNPEFLESASSKFSQEYQRRLRKYLLVNHDLSALPANQFGFVFSWNYFNYVSLDTTKQYLQQVMNLLRPGGTFMFSFNDGDTPAGAGMAESFARTYMPSSMLLPMCESLGYIVDRVVNPCTSVSWVEVRKPGTLSTTKAHQALGEIKHKHSG